MTNQNIKFVSTNLLGSHLYGLQSKKSDLDYMVLYRRQPKDYICFGAYNDFMPPNSLGSSYPIISYNYWDIKKFLFLAGKSSFGALEVLYAFDAYFDNPVYKYVLSEVKMESFSLRELLYHARGVINSNHHRGYMKAFYYVFTKYLLQHKSLPPSLFADDMLNRITLTDHFREHIEKIFDAKRNGVKDMPFIIESYGDESFKQWPKAEPIDYTSVLHRCIFDF